MPELTPEDYFAGSELGIVAFRAVDRLVRPLGQYEVRVSKSQVAFRARRGFAYLWLPANYVTGGPEVVLSLSLPRRLPSDRFREVVHPADGVWMHHLAVDRIQAIDEEVGGWLVAAYEAAR